MKIKYALLILCFFLIISCETENHENNNQVRGQYIGRRHDEFQFAIPKVESASISSYPWEKECGLHPRITKDFFRCKGSLLNPVRVEKSNEEVKQYYDCSGSESHSLPVQDGKEFIYGILVTLLNEIQNKTGNRVIITSGHRCPAHNAYVDSSKNNQFSKHQLGAEVSFYVQGLADQPERIVEIIQNYYQSPHYSGRQDMQVFKRWDKDTDVITLPWYNKEIFIKLYTRKEGRNFDNRHPYPYISIQVRYDVDKDEKVHYSWDKAFNNYMRW